MPYNPQGALNGLFAPAYIPGNPESVAATTAWNANRGAPPPGTPPVGTPPVGTPPVGTPPVGAPPPYNPVGGGIGNNPQMQALMSRLPPQVQARFGSRFGGAPAPAPAPAGGSFQFTEPTLPPAAAPAGGLPPAAAPAAAAPVNAMRNNIAQTLMTRRPGYGV